MKIMTVFGTRPEAIKMAPVIQELLGRPEIETKVCITAQHREMLDQVVDLFGIPVDYDLNIMEKGQTLYDITERILTGLREVLERRSLTVFWCMEIRQLRLRLLFHLFISRLT
jgi:UDP-N-acetylglucosamine 2-epimerase (non-hydrolysing)